MILQSNQGTLCPHDEFRPTTSISALLVQATLIPSCENQVSPHISSTTCEILTTSSDSLHGAPVLVFIACRVEVEQAACVFYEVRHRCDCVVLHLWREHDLS